MLTEFEISWHNVKRHVPYKLWMQTGTDTQQVKTMEGVKDLYEAVTQ